MAHAKSNSNSVRLGKQLSWLLRHGAKEEGIPMQADGFVLVDDLLRHPRYASAFTLAKLQEIVAADAKNRYSLRRSPATNAYEIRANQGHSLASVEADAALERVLRATDVEMAVHGTYYKSWQLIRTQGLKRFQRNHVHFAISDKTGAGGSISGFRSDCQVLIYLNVAKVLADKLPLYRSANNVILCAGVDGCIAPTYFERVLDRRTHQSLSLE